MLAALCIALPGAIEAFTGETVPTSVVLGFSPALAIPFLLALHLRQLPSADRAGDIGFAVNLVGLGLFGGAAFALNVVVFPLGDEVADNLEPVSRLALLFSAAVFVIGVVLFGAAMLRARVHPRPPAWLYILGFPPFALAAPLPDSPLTSALHVLVGVDLAWLAAALWSSSPSGAESWVQDRSGRDLAQHE